MAPGCKTRDDSWVREAAMSHVELALSNLSARAHLLEAEDCELLGKYVSQLQELALSHGTLEPREEPERVSNMDNGSPTETPSGAMCQSKHAEDIEEQLGARSEKYLQADTLVGAPPPPEPVHGFPEESTEPEAGRRISLQKSTSGLRDNIVKAGEGGRYGPEQAESESSKDGPTRSPSFIALREKQDWLVTLIGIFDYIDVDNSGAIEKKEWHRSLKALGNDDENSHQVFVYVDVGRHGLIHRLDWLHMLEHVRDGSCPESINAFTDFLRDVKAKNGYIGLRPTTASLFVLHPESVPIMIWNLTLVFLLFYIALSLPYSLGFGADVQTLQNIGDAIDVVFMVDVVVNFRTAIYRDDALVFEDWPIAVDYLKTWFLLDVLTCFPFERVTAGLLPGLQPGKMVKAGKMFKVVKLLRIIKLKTKFLENEFLASLLDKLDTKKVTGTTRGFALMLELLVVCHWLACGMSIAGTNWLQTAGGELEYLSAVYWAMTTLTTVGYGDVIPSGETERYYAIACMVVGGAFYGYLIGKLSSTIADQDRDKTALSDKMGDMENWLQSHSDLPTVLRHRVRLYYRKHLSAVTTTTDSDILDNLSPALAHDVSFFLLPAAVRGNELFTSLPGSALAMLLPILQLTDSEADDTIVRNGDQGTTMYIVIEGVAILDRDHPPDPTAECFQAKHGKELLTAGLSWGEEILLCKQESYLYTVVARTAMQMYSISETAFGQVFTTMPEVRLTIEENYMRNRPKAKILAPAGIHLEVAPAVVAAEAPKSAADKAHTEASM